MPIKHRYLTVLPFIFHLLAAVVGQAQVSSDPTLSTQVTLDGTSFNITGGTQAERNLFHSFSEFSLSSGWAAFFDNAQNIQNIIARVTGSNSASNINGLIKANGNANLFLINPSGIILGRGARLDIGGSFIATTAEQLKFADGSTFNAKDLQVQPLLTVSTPAGLQFGAAPKSIIANQVNMLRVKRKQTIAFVGGEISLQNSFITAPEGRVELGSLAGNSSVSLNHVHNGWTVGYSNIQSFQDIQISSTTLKVGNPFFLNGLKRGTRLGLGDIKFQGKNISIVDNSEVGGFNNSSNPGGAIIFKASGSINISNSSLRTQTINKGSAGSIFIDAKNLTISNSDTDSSSQVGIFTSAENGSQGLAGGITINTAQSVELKGNSVISSRTFGAGNASDVQITTGKLVLQDGAQISSSALSANNTRETVTGNGGTVRITAADSINVIGTGLVAENVLTPSGILAQSKGPKTIGNGGNVVIDTNSLVVQDGGIVSVAATDDSRGEAGSLNIQASTIEVRGADSTIQAAGESSQTAGSVNITTNILTVQDGARISVSSPKGQAGNLTISANQIYLDNGFLTAETGISGPEGSGNIQLQNVKFLQLNNSSLISAEATGDANGGNIFIDAADGFVVGVSGGDSTIKASADEGKGGNITITAKGIYGFVEGKEVKGNGINEIDASSDFGPSGTVQLNTPDVDPSQTIIELPSGLVDASGMIMQRCSAPTAKTTQQPESSFIIAGRGGLPPNPSELLSSDAALVNLVAPAQSSTIPNRSTIPATVAQTTPTQIVEAQRWIIDADGSIVLTAQVPTQVSYSVGLTQDSCFGP
jgi:filamentous hemagglutinin family protein